MNSSGFDMSGPSNISSNGKRDFLDNNTDVSLTKISKNIENDTGIKFSPVDQCPNIVNIEESLENTFFSHPAINTPDKNQTEPKIIFNNGNYPYGQYLPFGTMGISHLQFPNMQFPNMQFPNMQFPNMQFPNMQFPNTQYPNMQFPNMQFSNIQYPNMQQPVITYPIIAYPNMQHLITPSVDINRFNELNMCDNNNNKITDNINSNDMLIDWYSKGYNSGFDSGYVRGLISHPEYVETSNISHNTNYSPNLQYSQSTDNLLAPLQNEEQEKKNSTLHTCSCNELLQNYRSGYTSGYNSGIKNYINAVDLLNTYNPNKNVSQRSSKNTNNEIKKEHSKYVHRRKNKKNPHDKSKHENKDIIDQINPTDALNPTNPLIEGTKPFLIIRKINKGENTSESNDLGSMLHNLFGNEEDNNKKESVNYLEDSDDENDNLVTLEDVKCDEDFKNKKKEIFKDIKVISLQEIIEKSNIMSIDDLITIGNYYEKNFIIGKTVKNESSENIENNEPTFCCENDVNKLTDIDEEEFKVLESIIKNLGIVITPTTNIIINNKSRKDVSTSLEQSDKSIENNDPVTKNIIELYKIGDVYYTINLEKVYNMRGHLIKLKKMIGLDNIKNEIIDMILYYLMEFEKKNNNMLHMTLEGSPGCGKTKLAKIISKLLGAMGILDNNKVVYARRTDMIGQYLGQTGQKTQQVINSALGGVLFIDEAYSLGSSKKDIYSKECLDILNQNLSDNKKKLVCIIAGYPEELENYFFSSNPGLTRRFPFRFKIIDYTSLELCNIFINKINKLEWKLENTLKIEDFFKDNVEHFKFFGGDIDTFIQDIKYSHSRRVVCSHPSNFRIIIKKDINNAFDKFKNRRKNKHDSAVDWKSLYT